MTKQYNMVFFYCTFPHFFCPVERAFFSQAYRRKSGQVQPKMDSDSGTNFGQKMARPLFPDISRESGRVQTTVFRTRFSFPGPGIPRYYRSPLN
jgi:hypothetical protein